MDSVRASALKKSTVEELFDALAPPASGKVFLVLTRSPHSKLNGPATFKLSAKSAFKFQKIVELVREELGLNKSSALFFKSRSGKLIKADMSLAELEEREKGLDGLVWLEFREMSAFGACC